MAHPASTGSFFSFLDPLTGADQLRLEKARLEAFLDAVPGEYCGFAPENSVIYSPGFAALLGLESVQNIHDVVSRFAMKEAGEIENAWEMLQHKGQEFSLTAPLDGQPGSRIKLSGTQGLAMDGRDRFCILWAEDVSTSYSALHEAQQKTEEAERKASRLQNILGALPRLFWLRGKGSELQWVNDAYATAFDKPADTIVAEQTEIATTGKTKAPAPKEMARNALDTGEVQHVKSHVILRGKRKWMDLSETPLPGGEGTFGIALDLTREEELENELTRDRAGTKELLEQLRTAIAIYGSDERLEFYNSAYAQLWGLEDEWLNKKPKLGEVLERLRETRRLPEQADFRKYKDSWIRWFTALIDPHEDMLYLPDGTALRMLVVANPAGGLMLTFEDVTSRLALESSYNTLIAVQRETLDNLAEGVAVFGGDGRLKLWNPTFAKLWGYNPEELDGEPHITGLTERISDLFAAEEWPRQKQLLAALALERDAQEGKLTLADERTFDYATVALPDGGKLVSYSDITATMKVETALREKNAALETAERLKLDFLANVSYQLRTPLAAIMGFSEILTQQYFGPLNDKQKEYTDGIEQAGKRLLSLVDDILDLSTIEAGYLELHKSDINTATMLQSVYELTQDWARKSKIEITLDVPAALGTAMLDERRIKQVLVNLIRNAINHTPEGGSITLSGMKTDDALVLIVSDTGEGIAAADQERVFSPFTRAGEQKGNQRGAGLGLSLVKNIVELHGGSVSLSSEKGKGTIVTLTLPKA